jgi:ribosomal protein S18 acetylase RimI-like enzyme
MDISFRSSENLREAATLTFKNMRSYYEQYGVSWDSNIIEDETVGLENYDIIADGVMIGVFRLQYENDSCYLRDLQVEPSHQNLGIGQMVLNEVKRRAIEAKLNTVQLRVFKISPAVELYKRNGFELKDEDDRFFNLAADVS